METFSALLAICAGNSPASGEFPAQRPVTRSFDVFCDLCLNKRLRKQSWGWWFETLPRPLWRHCNVMETFCWYMPYKRWWYNLTLWIPTSVFVVTGGRHRGLSSRQPPVLPTATNLAPWHLGDSLISVLHGVKLATFRFNWHLQMYTISEQMLK